MISFSIPDMLLIRMFEMLKSRMDKNEIRYMMKKFRFPDDKIANIEQTYHGKDKVQDRVYNALLFWKEFRGPLATADELIRVFHIVGYDELCLQLRNIRIMAQRTRF